MKKLLSVLISAVLISGLSSCLDSRVEDVYKTADFEFKTTKEYSLSVTTLNPNNNPVLGAYVELYTENPLDQSGKQVDYSKLIFKGMTNQFGEFDCKISAATTADSLYVLTNYVGLPAYKAIALSSDEIHIVIGGVSTQSANSVGMRKVSAAVIPTVTKTPDGKYYVLGSWNNQGVPNYLMSSNDVVDNEFLGDINASLPERIELPVSHPEYLQSNEDGNLVLVDDAEVWITFVHEGAGNLNSLLYYSYPTGSEPATTSEIINATVIYPNVSYVNSGGGLVSGNKVQLFYLNPTTNQYTDVFPKGTTIAWMFKGNSWKVGSNLGTGIATYYSDVRFNPETNVSKKKHNVILKDNSRKLLLMGFEDLNRETGSDNDFNDGVFYATVTPFTAVKSDFYKPIDSPTDTDKDGVGDTSDEYPTDPTRAFNNYYPSETETATLAFEDLWPHKGDYDFNDMIVDYNFNQITNADNKVVAVEARLAVRSIGASYVNGFGIQFNTPAENVKSVTNQTLTEGIVKNLASGAESNQTKAVVIAFDNAFKLLPHAGNTSGVNTINGSEYVEPQTKTINIEFVNPVAFADFGTPPYNPFIFINRDRTKEVHLPASEPTDIADLTLLGTADDDLNINKGKYYMSDKYLPWAINLPTQFDYPAEKEDITKTYLLFNSWANSSGYKNMDWYLNKTGYRDGTKIFKK